MLHGPTFFRLHRSTPAVAWDHLSSCPEAHSSVCPGIPQVAQERTLVCVGALLWLPGSTFVRLPASTFFGSGAHYSDCPGALLRLSRNLHSGCQEHVFVCPGTHFGLSWGTPEGAWEHIPQAARNTPRLPWSTRPGL